MLAIEDVRAAINQIAQTTLRKVVGQHTLDQTPAKTDMINLRVLHLGDQPPEPCRQPDAHFGIHHGSQVGSPRLSRAGRRYGRLDAGRLKRNDHAVARKSFELSHHRSFGIWIRPSHSGGAARRGEVPDPQHLRPPSQPGGMMVLCVPGSDGCPMANVNSLGKIADHYGRRWTAELLRTWSRGDQPAWAYGAGHERPQWVADRLPDLCAGLQGRSSAGSAAARRLLDLAWEWLGKGIGTGFALSSPSYLFAREQEARIRDETDLEWLATQWNPGALSV